MNHKILEHEFGVGVACLCVAGRGDSVDGVVTGWTVGFEPRWGQEVFSFSYLSGPALGPTQPCLQWEMAHFTGSTAFGAWSCSLIPM